MKTASPAAVSALRAMLLVSNVFAPSILETWGAAIDAPPGTFYSDEFGPATLGRLQRAVMLQWHDIAFRATVAAAAAAPPRSSSSLEASDATLGDGGGAAPAPDVATVLYAGRVLQLLGATCVGSDFQAETRCQGLLSLEDLVGAIREPGLNLPSRVLLTSVLVDAWLDTQRPVAFVVRNERLLDLLKVEAARIGAYLTPCDAFEDTMLQRHYVFSVLLPAIWYVSNSHREHLEAKMVSAVVKNMITGLRRWKNTQMAHVRVRPEVLGPSYEAVFTKTPAEFIKGLVSYYFDQSDPNKPPSWLYRGVGESADTFSGAMLFKRNPAAPTILKPASLVPLAQRPMIAAYDDVARALCGQMEGDRAEFEYKELIERVSGRGGGHGGGGAPTLNAFLRHLVRFADACGVSAEPTLVTVLNILQVRPRAHVDMHSRMCGAYAYPNARVQHAFAYAVI